MAKPDFQLKWGVNRVGGIPTTDPADYQLGWQYRGGLPPLTGNFDYYQNLADERLLYLNQLGVSEWDGVQEYQIDSIANRGGTLYSCLTADHVSATPPESDAVNWSRIGGGKIQVFTTSGTYNKPQGLSHIKVTVVGGGGAGGCAVDGTYRGGGGGAAASAISIIDNDFLLSSETVTVAAGGVGTSVLGGSGGSGGSSSLGVHASADGGEGGAAANAGSAAGGAPGITGTGDIVIPGGFGSDGSSASGGGGSSDGGGSMMGGGGRSSGSPALSGLAFGSGGGGSGNGNLSGSGGNGIVIIEEFF